MITRPRELAVRLSARVRAASGRPIVFPALEIAQPTDLQAVRQLIGRLEQFDIAIFVSPTAVSRGLALIRAQRTLPPGLRIAAIGPGSARELQRLGIANVLVSDRGADSEALLELTELADMRGRSAVIFRGAGGRALIADTLTQRGASVEYAECYRRLRPSTATDTLLDAWNRGEVHAVTVTSREALSNLLAMLGMAGSERLRATPLFVPHERVARAARELGIAEIVVSGPGDEALVSALLGYFSRTS